MAGAIRTTASRTSVCPAVRTTENDRHQQSGTDHGLYCELNYVVFVFIQHLHFIASMRAYVRFVVP